MSELSICIHCGNSINTEREEFDRGKDNAKNTIYMCEECLDYSGYTLTHYENKNNTRRLNKFNSTNN